MTISRAGIGITALQDVSSSTAFTRLPETISPFLNCPPSTNLTVCERFSSSQWEHPQLVLDITDTIDLKLEAIRRHRSQVGDFKAVEARVRNRAAVLGKERGYSYAEGFDQIVVPG